MSVYARVQLVRNGKAEFDISTPRNMGAKSEAGAVDVDVCFAHCLA